MSKKAEETIKRVNASMTLEGMPLTQDDIDMGAAIVDGELTIEEAIAILNKRYSK